MILLRKLSNPNGLLCAAFFSIYSSMCMGDSSTLDTITSTNTFRIGYRTSSIPFSYLDDKQNIVGYSMDLCRSISSEIQKKLGLKNLKIEYVPITSQNRIVLLQSGAIDIDCGSTSNLQSRRKQADFSYNIFLAHIKMMVKAGSSIKDFKTVGKRAVVMTSGTSSDNALAEFAKKNNLEFNVIYGKDHANSFLLLITGRASAFVNDDSILYGLKARIWSRSKNFVILSESLRTEPYALMFRKNDPRFKKIVDGTLAKIMKSGEIVTLYRKWFMSPISPRGINLNMPLYDDTRKMFVAPNDFSAKG